MLLAVRCWCHTSKCTRFSWSWKRILRMDCRQIIIVTKEMVHPKMHRSTSGSPSSPHLCPIWQSITSCHAPCQLQMSWIFVLIVLIIIFIWDWYCVETRILWKMSTIPLKVLWNIWPYSLSIFVTIFTVMLSVLTTLNCPF